jgi:hypothetical protein
MRTASCACGVILTISMVFPRIPWVLSPKGEDPPVGVLIGIGPLARGPKDLFPPDIPDIPVICML